MIPVLQYPFFVTSREYFCSEFQFIVKSITAFIKGKAGRVTLQNVTCILYTHSGIARTPGNI